MQQLYYVFIYFLCFFSMLLSVNLVFVIYGIMQQLCFSKSCHFLSDHWDGHTHTQDIESYTHTYAVAEARMLMSIFRILSADAATFMAT